MKAREGTIFEADALEAVQELTTVGWTLPHASRVDSLTNFQHPAAKGDDIVVGELVPRPARELDAAGPIAVSAAMSMAVAGWLHYPLTPPAVAAPMIVLTVAVADGVHIVLAAMEGMREGKTRSQAIVSSLEKNLEAITYTWLTTIVGFVCLNYSEAPPVTHLANMTCFGVTALGAGLFTGLSRAPRFIAELTTGQISPRYELMQQGSVDAQWTLGPLVLKAEGFVRLWGDSLRAFGGGGGGADYTFFKILGDADVSLAAEFLFDTRPIDAAPTFFNHDGFVGVRVAPNDTSSTEVLAGALVDVVDQSTFAKAGISRRLGEHWRVSVDVNVFLGPHGKLERQDDYAHARIAYFF